MARVSRRARQQELVSAARRVFEERGVRDASMEEVARAAGINKAIIYRHFASKEELYVEALVEYLVELAERLASPSGGSPESRLEDMTRRFVRFGVAHPAFAASALELMDEPLHDLRARVSDAVLIRLGEAMARCLRPLAAVLAELGAPDADLLANLLYARCLGVLRLARLGSGVRTGTQGMPELFPVTADEIERACVADALATTRGGAS